MRAGSGIPKFKSRREEAEWWAGPAGREYEKQYRRGPIPPIPKPATVEPQRELAKPTAPVQFDSTSQPRATWMASPQLQKSVAQPIAPDHTNARIILITLFIGLLVCGTMLAWSVSFIKTIGIWILFALIGIILAAVFEALFNFLAARYVLNRLIWLGAFPVLATILIRSPWKFGASGYLLWFPVSLVATCAISARSRTIAAASAERARLDRMRYDQQRAVGWEWRDGSGNRISDATVGDLLTHRKIFRPSMIKMAGMQMAMVGAMVAVVPPVGLLLYYWPDHINEFSGLLVLSFISSWLLVRKWRDDR